MTSMENHTTKSVYLAKSLTNLLKKEMSSMGTRGAYGFHMNGKDKITYNHFDSYPIGLGSDVAAFIQRHTDERMAAIYDQIVLVDTEMVPTKEQIEECMPYYRPGVSRGTPEDWYCLLRGAQGSLEAHANGLRYMIDKATFLKDSLFCEWGYVINLDTGILEIYRGFQKVPQHNRYYAPRGESGFYYCNCALIREVPFATIRENPTYMAKLEDELEQAGEAI